MNPADTHLDAVTERKLFWKSAETMAYAVEVVQVARSGIEFNNDDIAEPKQPRDKSTVGIVFRSLRRLGIIEYAGRIRHSTRPCCNGHANPLYRIASIGKADAFLRVNKAAPKLGQLELIAA